MEKVSHVLDTVPDHERHPLKEIFSLESDSCAAEGTEDDDDQSIAGPITRLCFDDDGDQECITRTPTEVAASIFRQQQQEDKACNTIPPNPSSDGSSTLGNLLDHLWAFYRTKRPHEEASGDIANEADDSLEPIPLELWQANGIPVGITSNSEEDDTMESSTTDFCDDLTFQSVPRISSTFGANTENDGAAFNSSPQDRRPEERPPTAPDLYNDIELVTIRAPRLCISPDPTMRGGEIEVHGYKRKQATETTGEEEERLLRPEKRTKLLPVVIGPEAPQMAPIHRLLESLQRDESSLETCELVKKIVNECCEMHRRGSHKYKDLPGAIVDSVVKQVGATEFQRLFRLSQTQGTTQDYRSIEHSPSRIA